MKKTIFLDKKIDVLIVSAGGVGTTFLMEEIGKYKTTNCSSNTDGYKHLPIPPISFNRNLKVVYVFGNPIMASISLFRRQYHHTQSIKSQEFFPSDFIIPFEMSLEKYANDAKDGFHFQRHFDQWKKEYPIYPTLFLKYETLFEQIEIVADFLDLPKDFVPHFPPKKIRKSNLANLSETTIKGLEKMYATFAKKMKQLPDTTIQLGDYSLLLKKILTVPYYKALKKSFWKKMPLLRRIKHSVVGSWR